MHRCISMWPSRVLWTRGGPHILKGDGCSQCFFPSVGSVTLCVLVCGRSSWKHACGIVSVPAELFTANGEIWWETVIQIIVSNILHHFCGETKSDSLPGEKMRSNAKWCIYGFLRLVYLNDMMSVIFAQVIHRPDFFKILEAHQAIIVGFASLVCRYSIVSFP